jgi:hypothetical protein
VIFCINGNIIKQFIVLIFYTKPIINVLIILDCCLKLLGFYTFYENNILAKKIINEYSNYNQYNQAQKIVESKSNNFGQSLVTISIGQYTQDTRNWLLNLPTKLEVTHDRDGKTTTRETTYTYSDGNLIRPLIAVL